jgi:hypothetical protein
MSDVPQVPDSLSSGGFETALAMTILDAVVPLLIRKGVLSEDVPRVESMLSGLGPICMGAARHIAQWAFDQEDWAKDASN